MAASFVYGWLLPDFFSYVICNVQSNLMLEVQREKSRLRSILNHCRQLRALIEKFSDVENTE
jgi:hypothetical protein